MATTPYPNQGEIKMTTKSTTSKKAVSSTKNSPVVITAPRIELAWNKIVEVSINGEQATIQEVLNLGKEMKSSQLSIRDIMKAIESTGLKSPFIKVSHVEGIPTLVAMQKVSGFSALPLSKQLSTAVASYKLLGAGIGEQLPSLEAIEKANAQARKAKIEQAQEGTKKESSAKAPKSNADTLNSILKYFTALNVSTLTEAEQNLVAEIEATVGNLMANA
jgi:hypothetical protein